MRSRHIKDVFLAVIVVAGRCHHEPELDPMFGKSRLTKALEKWTKQGGDIDEVLASSSERPVKSKAEAKAICAALDALRAEPSRAGDEDSGSPLDTVVAFFQEAEGQEALEVLAGEGLPRLRLWVRDSLNGQDASADSVMFILKILAMYGQRADVDLIAEAARKSLNSDGYMWSMVFGSFDAEHDFTSDMVEALRDPLPTGFIRVAYLDMANGLAIAGKLSRHPFDTDAGRKHLKTWLRDTNEEHFSYAKSATAALPFIESTARGGLFQVAAAHPHMPVRSEAAWAQAKSGDPVGLDRLAELCLDPRYSQTAQAYLEELEYSDRIPKETQQPEFQAIAEMASWLAHPMEFGRPPTSIELFDTRELFWPPTNDSRRLSLVKYTYNDAESGKPEVGVGLVGSATFALFSETTADMSPEDIYGLHCCWELELKKDSRAPKKRTAKAGRQILARKNADF